MVRQLLTVSRIESGALRPRQEVFSPAVRVRRTWEALGAADVPFTLEDDESRAGSPSPTPTSWTRSCGRSSTTR